MGGGEGAGGVAGATRRACVTPHRLGSIRAHHFRCPVAGTGPVDPSRPLAATHPRAPFDRAYGTAKQAPRTSCPGAAEDRKGGAGRRASARGGPAAVASSGFEVLGEEVGAALPGVGGRGGVVRGAIVG